MSKLYLGHMVNDFSIFSNHAYTWKHNNSWFINSNRLILCVEKIGGFSTWDIRIVVISLWDSIWISNNVEFFNNGFARHSSQSFMHLPKTFEI